MKYQTEIRYGNLIHFHHVLNTLCNFVYDINNEPTRAESDDTITF